MSAFEYVTAGLLLILGLGVTELLNALVEIFRSRRRARLHWIPLAWASMLFVWQMQFLWAVYELSGLVGTWTIGAFVSMVTLALLLFLAGALVLPRGGLASGVDALEEFQMDGRWSLLFLGLYCVAAFFVNPLLFEAPVTHPLNLFALALGVFLLIAVRTKTERHWSAVTLAFMPCTIAVFILWSPKAYS